MYQKEFVLKQLQNSGLKSTDTVMIHSAFSQIKNIEGGANGLLDVLKTYFKDGLLLLPSHTWASVNFDGAYFDKNEANSCVGYLTNVAIKDKEFLRSNHPTHSILAYGHKAKEYIKDDDNAITPASLNGSFNKLKYGAKILFLGAPLSKNTFIHSIEEEMNVPDRFTTHIYHFITKDNDRHIDFYMPRHFSTKHPHISENYEKLLPIMLKKKIAHTFSFMDIDAILVDAQECYKLVKTILEKDLHAFDDLRDVECYA